MTAATLPPMRVLVVDDDPISRLIVAHALASRFEVVLASNGVEAVKRFAERQPDAVLLDVEMPEMDGITAAARIKELAGESLVPVFLLSGAESVSTLARGLEAGADDFLPKPFDVRVFLPKLQVFLRLRNQHQRIVEQHRALDEYQRTTEFEHALAGRIFDRLARRADLSGLRTHLSPLTRFTGDTLLAARAPSGAQRVLISDLTGHGLVAAIASMPLSSVFYDSTARDEPLSLTLERLNGELYAALPRSLFAAAAMLEHDPAKRTLTVVNAGMPSIFVRTPADLLEVPSQSVPLGVVPSLAPAAQIFEAVPGSSVLAMSDGVVERAGDDGELFGVERVRAVLRKAEPAGAFDSLLREVSAFSPGNDDVTLVALTIPVETDPANERPTPLRSSNG